MNISEKVNINIKKEYYFNTRSYYINSLTLPYYLVARYYIIIIEITLKIILKLNELLHILSM